MHHKPTDLFIYGPTRGAHTQLTPYSSYLYPGTYTPRAFHMTPSQEKSVAVGAISEGEVAISRAGRSIPHQNGAHQNQWIHQNGGVRYQWFGDYGFGVFRQSPAPLLDRYPRY